MVAFRASEAEQALFEDGIASIPEGKSKTEALVVVANAADAVFGPAIGARAGVIVSERVPGARRTGCSPRAGCPRRVR